MSIFRRFRNVMSQKASAAVDRAEDPRQALDLSYQQLLEEQQRVRRAIVEASTARARLQNQADDLDGRARRLDGQAELALQAGREELAEEALRRQAALEQQRSVLTPQLERVTQQVAKLEQAAKRYGQRLDAFRAQSQTLKAQYAAAQAQSQASDAIAGVGEHSQDIALMLQRAQDKIAQTQAHADAVQGLIDSGGLDDPLLGAGDDLDQRLAIAGADTAVQARLAEMKARLHLEAPRAQVRPVPRLPAPDAPQRSGESVVVRIHGEEQYRLPATARAQLDSFDAELVAAVAAAEEAHYSATLTSLLDYVRKHGEALPGDELAPSDIVVPSGDMGLEEARSLLGADPGLSPGTTTTPAPR